MFGNSFREVLRKVKTIGMMPSLDSEFRKLQREAMLAKVLMTQPIKAYLLALNRGMAAFRSNKMAHV